MSDPRTYRWSSLPTCQGHTPLAKSHLVHLEGRPIRLSASALCETLRDLAPGCRDSAGCQSCERWNTVAAAVARRDVPARAVREYTRDEWVDLLTDVVAEALAAGFEPHQARAPADKIEEGSQLPAADSDCLMAALAVAQQELDRHAAASLAGDVVEPHPSFTSDVIWPGGTVAPPSTVRSTSTDVTRWDDAAFAVLCQTLVEDLATGCLQREEPKATVPVFATALTSKPRMITNLRSVNAVMAESTVRYPTAAELAGCGLPWLVKLDLKAAFKRVRVPRCAAGWLGFRINDAAYTYHRLPFGWSWSPEVFSKTLDRALEEARAQGIPFVAYVDDVAVAGADPATCVQAATRLMVILRRHGWIISPAKAFLRPVRILRFLGLRVRSEPPGLGVLPKMAAKARDELHLARRHGCARHVLTIWGVTAFVASTAWPHLALTRSALDAVAAAVIAGVTVADMSPDAWDATLQLAARAVLDLEWAAEVGVHNIAGWQEAVGRPLHLATDASDTGAGALLRWGHLVLETAAEFDDTERLLPSAARELRALEVGIQTWLPLLASTPHRPVRCTLDAQAAVYATQRWSSASDAGRAILNRLWRLVACARPERFSFAWEPRESRWQVEADRLSRVAPSRPPAMALTEDVGGRVLRLVRTIFGEAAQLRHDDALPGYILAPAYTAHIPVEPAAQRRRHKYLGPPSLPADSSEVVLIHPTTTMLGRAGRSTLTWAWNEGALGVVIIATELAFWRCAALRPWWELLRTRVMLVARGQTIRRTEGARWVETRATSAWFAYVWMFRDPDTLVNARASADVRLASGDIHPNPGPFGRMFDRDRGRFGRRRRMGELTLDEAWSRAATATRAPTTPAPVTFGERSGGRVAAAEHPSMRQVLWSLAGHVATGYSMQPAATLARCHDWAPELPPALRSQWIAAVASVDADRSEATQQRATRSARELLCMAEESGAADQPFSAELLDAVATAWVRARLRMPGSLHLREDGGRRTWAKPSPATVAQDLSAVAARLRRRYTNATWKIPLVGLGPLSGALLDSAGARVRHEASPKRPVFGWELRHGMGAKPAFVAEHAMAVTVIVVTGALMWRNVYVRNLQRDMVAEIDNGANYLIVWRGAHKTDRHRGKDGVPNNLRCGFLVAPWVTATFRQYLQARDTRCSGRSIWLFPSPTDASQPCAARYLTETLRSILQGLPAAATATLHGLRVGADSEARLNGVSDEARDFMGWWKRQARRMSEHYEAVDVDELKRAAAAYGTLVVQGFAPGLARVVGAFSAGLTPPTIEPITMDLRAGSASRLPVTPRGRLGGRRPRGGDARSIPRSASRGCENEDGDVRTPTAELHSPLTDGRPHPCHALAGDGRDPRPTCGADRTGLTDSDTGSDDSEDDEGLYEDVTREILRAAQPDGEWSSGLATERTERLRASGR